MHYLCNCCNDDTVGKFLPLKSAIHFPFWNTTTSDIKVERRWWHKISTTETYFIISLRYEHAFRNARCGKYSPIMWSSSCKEFLLVLLFDWNHPTFFLFFLWVLWKAWLCWPSSTYCENYSIYWNIIHVLSYYYPNIFLVFYNLDLVWVLIVLLTGTGIFNISWLPLVSTWYLHDSKPAL